MTNWRWVHLALLGARWLDRSGLRRLSAINWLARQGRDIVFGRSAGFPKRYVETEVDGFRLRLPQRLAAGYLRDFEPLTQRYMADSIQPGAVVVDVGANIGFHTLHFARTVGSLGHVHAFEPAADNLPFLRWNVAANELSNVTIHPLAAGSSIRRRTFHLQAKGTHHGFYPRKTHKSSSIEVEERPLNEVLSPPVDFVKIDTEGAEIEVLRGMERIVRGSPSVKLLVEWNLEILRDQSLPLEQLPELLERWGFEVVVLDERKPRRQSVQAVLESLRARRFGPLRALNLGAVPSRRDLGEEIREVIGKERSC